MKIGIIGAGYIGRALARLAVAAGDEVMIANSRDPSTLTSTAVALRCQTGTAEDAARFGDAVVVSVPFTAIGGLPAAALAGKLVLDTCNHYPQRDGADPALEAMTETTGERLAAVLPGARVVKAFNAILQGELETDARAPGAGDRRALPIAGDDAAARAEAAALIDRWGFDTVDAGSMAESWRFERAMPAYCIAFDRAGLTRALEGAVRGERLAEGSWRTARARAKARDHSSQIKGFAGRGRWDVVDSQVHIGLAPTIPELLAAMDALGIRMVIADELWGFRDGRPIPFARSGGTIRPISIVGQQAAQQHPERFAFIQRISREDAMLDQVIRLLGETPGCVGLRIVLPSRDERRHFAAGEWDPALRLAAELGLPVDFLSAELAPLARDAVARVPGLSLVADHCGWGASIGDWAEVLTLADLPGVSLKWAHMDRTFRHFPDPAAAARQGLVDAIDAFGPERVMWASDVSAEDTDATWSELLDFARAHPDLTDTQRTGLLGGAARRVYGLSKEN